MTYLPLAPIIQEIEQKADATDLSGLATHAEVDQVLSAVMSKADATATTNALATKADAATVQTALGAKADAAATNSAIATKASQAALDMLSGTVAGKASQSAVDTLAATVGSKASTAALSALAATVPVPSTSAPRSEAVTPAAGAAANMQVAKDDHQHPRLTSTNYATLGSNGQATVTFTRTFPSKPGLVVTETDAATTSQPLVIRGLSWVMSGSLYAGVTIQGMRAQPLPPLNPLTGVITLVTQVVTGVNSLIASLTGYNVFGGSAAGATVSVIAVARSDV